MDIRVGDVIEAIGNAPVANIDGVDRSLTLLERKRKLSVILLIHRSGEGKKFEAFIRIMRETKCIYSLCSLNFLINFSSSAIACSGVNSIEGAAAAAAADGTVAPSDVYTLLCLSS